MEEAPSFDWPSFFSLFWNDKGIKCKVNIPDTVLFRYGQLSAWWATNKEGQIQRHTSQSTTVEAIRRRFLQVANEDEANYSKFVCISRLGNGRPQLLRLQAFNQLCEILSDRLESGHPDEAPEIETPSVLQAFVQPYQDLRYVTTYLNNGVNITCHTFQRKYSRRYTPMSATAAATMDNRDADIILAGKDAEARRADIDKQQGAVDPNLKMQLRKLTAHIVKYIERAHHLTLGGLVVEFIRDSSGKVYLLSVLRTEWASNAMGHGAGSLSASNIVLEPEDLALDLDIPDIPEDGEEEAVADLAMAAAEAVAPRGAGSGAASPVSQQPAAGSSGTGRDGDRAGPAAAATAAAAAAAGTAPYYLTAGYNSFGTAGGGEGWTGASAGQRPMSARPATASSSAHAMGTGAAGLARAGLVQFPGGQRNANLGVAVANSWPSLQHESSLGPSSPGPSSLGPSAAEHLQHPHTTPHNNTSHTPGLRVQSARPALQSHQSLMAERKVPPRPISSPSKTRPRSPGQLPSPGAAQAFTGHAQQSSSPGERPRTATSIVTATGAHVNGGARGAPLLIQQLQKEVETLRDQMLYQHELAEASAAKVRQLEREKEIAAGAFDTRVNELQHLLNEARQDLQATRTDRDSLRELVQTSEARAAQLEAEHTSLTQTLQAERGTTMTALGEYQDRDNAQRMRIEQLEAEVLRLSEQLKTEATTNYALKRQLLEFSEIAERHRLSLRDANLEPGLDEVLRMVNHLISDQTNPMGEEYAVQKCLVHYHADLRSVFLYYAQLEHTFTDHWPPTMTFSQWMLLAKDTETSDIRAGARIRSNVHFLMLHPSECENIFYRYARPDEFGPPGSQGGAGDPVLSYEQFLACIIHTASKLRRAEIPYLSEALREYILRYLARANRVNPAGLRKGEVRQALEGTKEGRHAKRAMAMAAAQASSEGVGGGLTSRRSSKPGSKKSSRPASAMSQNISREASKLSKQDVVNSAIMADLAVMGLEHITHSREIVRRGGGFDLP